MVKRASESLEGPPRCPQPRAGVASFPRARAPGPVLPCAPPGWARLMGSLSDAPRYRLSRRKGGPGKPRSLHTLQTVWVAHEGEGEVDAERRGGALGARAAGKAGPGGRSRREQPAALPETRFWADGAAPTACSALRSALVGSRPPQR